MLTKTKGHGFQRHIASNKILYISLCLIFIAGVVCGGYFTEITDADKLIEVKEQYSAFCSGEAVMSFGEGYINTFSAALKTFLIIFCASLLPFAFPLAYASIFIKGFSIGFTVSFLKSSFGGCGFVLGVCSALIQLIFFVPLFFVSAALTVKFCMSRKNLRANDKKEYFLACFMILIFSALISLPAAWISIMYPGAVCGLFY